MAAEFISLADYLRPQPPRCDATDTRDEAAPAVESPDLAVESPDDGGESPDELGAALRDARLFRARLADAFDEAVARLVRELAANVVMRELRLAPCDIAALVAQVRERAPVVRVRVAAGDVARVRGVPVVADDELAPGDAIAEVAGGALDARLGVRLAAVLEAFA
ncbi:MAG TPA: FliH/SctL family protein [Candidatus Limnocylindrales bacterium]|nr:FliH/SctL family protein [Candidatus Limnocylindrales bacterium]